MNEIVNSAPYYGMFTDSGNRVVHEIVLSAKENKLSWFEISEALSKLSEIKLYAEAQDTMVREIVYCTMRGE